MADRNRSDRDNHDQDQAQQFEQFEDSSNRQQTGWNDQDTYGSGNAPQSYGGGNAQMGDTGRGRADFYYEEVILVPRQNRSAGSRSGYGRERDSEFGGRGYRSRDEGERNYGSRYGGREEYRNDYRGNERGYDRGDYRGYGRDSGYGPNTARRYSSFTSEDQGGRDFSSPTGRRASSYGAAPGGTYGDRNRERDDGYSSPRYSDPRRERDWWDRTTDEIASWFGDEEAQRRREQDHRGRGPSDYTRSDDRIREDVNENLTNDWAVDARNVRVKVENGEVTLDGTVSTRLQTRRAEDCAEDVSGVKHVQNNLRVQDADDASRTESTTTRSSASKIG